MKKLLRGILDTSFWQLVRRRLTEQQRGPLTESNFKGYWFPDPFQKRLKRYDRLYDAENVFPIRNSIDLLVHQLFGYPDRELTLHCDDREAVNLLNEQFHPWHSRCHVFPHLPYIHNFLTDCAGSLLLLGRVFRSILWSDDGKHIVRIGYLPVETMKVFRHGKHISRFRQRYSLLASHEVIERAIGGSISGNKDYRWTTFYFSPDEVFFLEWTLDGERHRGVSPAKRALKFYKEWQAPFERIALHAEAWAHPEFQDPRHVRARYYSTQGEMEKQGLAELEMQRLLRVSQDVPKTEYYDVWQLKTMLQHVGHLRTYLLQEFNAQIVGAILKRNNIEAKAEYVCDYEPTNDEIEELFQRYVAGKIGCKEVVDEMLADRAPRRAVR